MSEYTVIGGIRSRALRVLWMLEELGVPYSHIDASPRSDEVLAVNPSGKIPVLVVDSVPISDSVAILTYLADRHGQFAHPAGTLERARQDSLTHQILDEIDALLWTAARHSFILPEEHRVPDVKDSLKWEFERNQNQLAHRMAEDGPFLMGETMTIADILLAHCMGWAITAKFPVVNERLKAHAAMMRDRPAFTRALKS